MNQDWLTLFELVPVQRALIALLLAGSTLPIVGVWIIGLNIVPVRFAMMHVALLGVAIGTLINIDPLMMGIGLCAVTGVALSPLSTRPTGLSGPMGLVMTLAIAIALLIMSITGVNANGAFEWLWGSILAIRTQDVVVLGIVATSIVLIYWYYRSQLTLLLYDRDIAICSGVNANVLTALLMGVIAVAIATSVRLTGALLVDAVTILPAIAARNLGRSLGEMVAWAVGIGVFGNLMGFALTLMFNQPPGPMLILTVGMITLASYINRQP
jgi:zinc transport system permease protein